jgi:hypothetical protein
MLKSDRCPECGGAVPKPGPTPRPTEQLSVAPDAEA